MSQLSETTRVPLDVFRYLPAYSAWGFQPLKLKDRASYDAHIATTGFPVDIWSSNFAYLWAHTRKPRKQTVLHSSVEGMLVIWILTARGRLYLPCLPVGAGPLADVVEVLSRCARFCTDWNRESGYGHKPVVAKLSSNQLEFFQRSDPFNRMFEPRLLTGIERHLSIERLTTLNGKPFSTIRYKLNKFQRDFPDARLRDYRFDDLDAVIRLGRQWKNTAGAKHRRILDKHYFKATLKHYRALGLENLVVERDGRIIGVTIGGPLPTGQAWGYLTKFDNRYNGLPEFLVVAMARRMREVDPGAELINIGTDFGSRRLAMAKEKFRPVEAYQRYALAVG